MAIVEKNNLLERIRTLAGDKAESDEVISLFDDIDDTFQNFENNENINWKEKYEENDRNWKKKYLDRFNNDAEDDNDDFKEEENKQQKELTYENLFTTEEA